MFSSCTAPKYIYSPATANLLQVEKRHDLQVAANYSSAGSIILLSAENKRSNGVDMQSVYAVSKKLSLKLSGYSKWEINKASIAWANESVEMIKYKKRGMEISTGIYNFSGEEKSSAFQLYGGIGFGKFSFTENRLNSNTSELLYHDMNYRKLFIQPSLTGKIGENYIITLATGLSMVEYSNIRTNYEELSMEPLGYINTKPSLFFDFVIQNEFGFKNMKGIKFQWQKQVLQIC